MSRPLTGTCSIGRRLLCAAVLLAIAPLAAGAATPELVVKVGDPAPGGGTYSGIFGGPTLNDSDVAFRAQITGGSVSDAIIRVDEMGTHTAVVEVGDPAIGTGGGTFSTLGKATMNAFGDIAFFANVTGGTTAQGIFVVDAAGNVTVRAVGGQAAPGGGVYTAFNGLDINSFGAVTFQSPTLGPSGVAGVFVVDSTGSGVGRAFASQTAPGTGGGTFSGIATDPSIDDAGRVVFLGSVTGGTTTEGVFASNSSSTVTPLALVGQTAPGTGGAAYTDLAWPWIGAGGGAVFIGIFMGDPGGLFAANAAGVQTPVILPGDPLPDTAGGTFGGATVFRANGLGSVVYNGNVAGGNTTGGIFVVDPLGTIRKIALVGEDAPGTGGGTFSSVGLASISRSGDVAFLGTVTGGSADRAFYVVRRPTPKLPTLSWAALAVLALLQAGLGWRRLRRPRR